jgi:hypothetical protein
MQREPSVKLKHRVHYLPDQLRGRPVIQEEAGLSAAIWCRGLHDTQLVRDGSRSRFA